MATLRILYRRWERYQHLQRTAEDRERTQVGVS